MKQSKHIFLLLSLLIGCALICGCGAKDPDPTTDASIPVAGSKQPSQYTWEEYLAMDEAQKLEFQKKFGSDAVFEAWKEMAQRGEAVEETIACPWENGGKQPVEYTWAEFEALSGELQMAFQQSFESYDAFEAWMQDAQHQAAMDQLELPWENGGKQPSEYTWAEFEALSGELQMAFQNSFESDNDFDVWMQEAQHREQMEGVELPWENGGKQPEDYTWAEFEALTAEEQMMFQNSFESLDAFEEWMDRAQNGAGDDPAIQKPEDCTWAEFEAMTPEQQMQFQNSFESYEAFEKWMYDARQEIDDPWEKSGAKQPKDYTWAEFEALTAEQQIRFQNSFGSQEAFEKWLQANMP